MASIKELYEKTELTQQQIADALGVPLDRVRKYLIRNYTRQERLARKAVCYRNSKLGEKNPMLGKKLAAHHQYIGNVGDGYGYLQHLKPDWYTGRRGSKHVFLHHLVVCQNLGLTEIPKGWVVHHCDFNRVNNEFYNLVLMTMGDHNRLHRYLDGVTTISKESTLKWVETYGTPWRRDIVSSAWEHAAVREDGQEVTTPVEDK